MAVKAAAPAAVKNNQGDEADVTAPPTPAPRGPKPPPMFVQNKDRWTELRRRCADKGIQFSQARNSAQGLKLQAKTVADFKNLQNLLVCYKFKFHTYSLKEERNRPRPTTKRLKPPSSKSGAYAPSPASKRSSPQTRAYPGSVITASPTGTRPVTAIILRAALNAWATMAQRNVRAIRTQTVHPPVSYAKQRPHGQLSWMPACSKDPPPEAVPLRARSLGYTQLRPSGGWTA
ncbi:hypothetical protein EVAR_35735_1 [Eumeta japonica]|uniref:Uncharacterized protein n=1 Tax=Eumeta variegata TaxID=151549 RepID=A0A4C1VEL1_EUMVA|nr:hypothetical protein EVAR_35735_1 [Eumeta japonica]